MTYYDDECFDDSDCYDESSDDDQGWVHTEFEEEWKPIAGHETYMISSFGNVKSRQQILKPWLKNGYAIVTLSKNNKNVNFRVHRLVADAFIENPLNKRQVDHINGNRLDNNVENLRWANANENMANRKKNKGQYTSLFKGVYFCEFSKKWISCLECQGKRIKRKFDDEIEGAKWYNEQAKKLFGEFAVLNCV